MDDNQPAPDSAADDGTTENPTGDAPGTDIAPEFELLTLEWRGQSWNVPKDRGQWDMNVAFEFEEGNRMRGVFTILGGSPAGINEARRAVYKVCRTQAEVDEFMDYATEFLNKNAVG